MRPVTLQELVQYFTHKFQMGAMPQSSMQAQRFVSALLDIPRYDFVLHPSHLVNASNVERLKVASMRFLQGEPLEYISGCSEFDGLRLRVTPDVLIPRPETEGIVERVHTIIKQKTWLANDERSALDLGTGSGCLAIAMERRLAGGVPRWLWHASDVSPAALDVAKDNANRHGASIDFRCGSWLEPWPDKFFDLVLCNPPYIGQHEIFLMGASTLQFEPKIALFAEDEGLAVYRHLARELPRYLHSGALVAFEIGFMQSFDIKEIFNIQGWQPGVIERDLSGHPRLFLIERE